MVEIAVGKPLFPSQTWLCSSFPCSSFISCIPYLHYSCPLPSVACSHTPGPASAVSHIILQKCKSLNTSFLYLSLFQCSERCLSPFRDFGLVTPVMHHTWSMENYKRFHAGERVWWFIGIICFCVKATGTAHTELIHLMTNSFRIGFVVGWYFYWSWYKIALHGKACCVFSVVLHLPNCKSDVIVLANSPVVSLMVVPAFGGL